MAASYTSAQIIWRFSGEVQGLRGERETITGVWGGAPSGVQGQRPWSGIRERSPSKAECCLALYRYSWFKLRTWWHRHHRHRALWQSQTDNLCSSTQI